MVDPLFQRCMPHTRRLLAVQGIVACLAVPLACISYFLHQRSRGSRLVLPHEGEAAGVVHKGVHISGVHGRMAKLKKLKDLP